MSNWKDCIDSILKLGFTKFTIINRANCGTIASSSAADIATLWKGSDDNFNQIDINENQELVDDWGDVKRATFCFYGRKFRILKRDDFPPIEAIKLQNNVLTHGYVQTNTRNHIVDDIINVISTYVCDIEYDENRMKILYSKKICKYIVGLWGHEIIIAYQLKTVWFVVYGTKKKMTWRRTNDTGKFHGAQQAWSKVYIYFQQLEEAGL